MPATLTCLPNPLDFPGSTKKHTNPGEYKTGNRGAPTVFREFIGLHAKRVQAGLRRRAYAGPELASLLPR